LVFLVGLVGDELYLVSVTTFTSSLFSILTVARLVLPCAGALVDGKTHTLLLSVGSKFGGAALPANLGRRAEVGMIVTHDGERAGGGDRGLIGRIVGGSRRGLLVRVDLRCSNVDASTTRHLLGAILTSPSKSALRTAVLSPHTAHTSMHVIFNPVQQLEQRVFASRADIGLVQQLPVAVGCAVAVFGVCVPDPESTHIHIYLMWIDSHDERRTTFLAVETAGGRIARGDDVKVVELSVFVVFAKQGPGVCCED
jgi:hypothetical protein